MQERDIFDDRKVKNGRPVPATMAREDDRRWGEPEATANGDPGDMITVTA